MARTPIQGLPYFPLLTKLDDDFKMVEALHGITGFGVAIKLHQIIYANSYYILADERFVVVFSNEINVDINSINAIISDSLKWNLFNQEIFDKFGVLTSLDIQEQYFSIIHRRKTVEVIEDLLVIPTPKAENIKIIANIYEINANINPINNNTSTQRERERKEKGKLKTNKRLFVESSDEFRLAKLLCDLILQNNPDDKYALRAETDNYQSWSDDIRKINQLDKRPFEEIEYLINWSQRSEFWFKNICSPSKLREKFDRLKKEIKSGKPEAANKLVKTESTGRTHHKLPGWNIPKDMTDEEIDLLANGTKND